MNDFDKYQLEAARTAKPITLMPPDVYTALGLNGEAGEVAEKLKKHYRDELDTDFTAELLKKELGDVLWYLSETARHWGFKLSDVAQTNIEKLASRRERGVVGGSGDNR